MRTIRGVVSGALTVLVAMQIAACGSSGGGTAAPDRGAASSAAPRTTTSTVVKARADTPRPRSRRREFTFKAQTLPIGIRQRITGRSWHQGCPVPLEQLRYIQMNHWGFDRKVRHGVMIVNADAVAAVRTAFRALFAKRVPIRRIGLRLTQRHRSGV